MVVDQQRRTALVAVDSMPAKINLADMLDREGVDEGSRVEAMIDGLDEYIVDVEQKPAPRAPHHLAQEFDLAHSRPGEGHIGGGILEQHPAADCLLHLVDMLAYPLKRLFRVRQRQEVVEIDGVMARPGEVLGEERGLVAGDQHLEAAEMLPVECPAAPDREPDAMQRHGIALADSAQKMVGRAAPPHVVLGMPLDPADVRGGLEDLTVMLGLQPNAGAGRERAVDRKA